MNVIGVGLLTVFCAADAAPAGNDASAAPLRTSVARVTQRPKFPSLMRTPTFPHLIRTPSWTTQRYPFRFPSNVYTRRFHTDYTQAPRFAPDHRYAHFKPRVDRRPRFRVSPQARRFAASYPGTRFRVTYKPLATFGTPKP